VQAFWIWALLAVSCQSPSKDAPGPDDTSTTDLETTDSGEAHANDSGEAHANDSGTPPSWPGSSETDRQAAVDTMVAAAQAFLASQRARRTDDLHGHHAGGLSGCVFAIPVP